MHPVQQARTRRGHPGHQRGQRGGDIATRVLVLYHLAAQRPMMGTFLEALGIAHESGLIQEGNVTPDTAKLGPAVTAIANAYPAADVSIYLNTLLCHDPETWRSLRGLPEMPA